MAAAGASARPRRIVSASGEDASKPLAGGLAGSGAAGGGARRARRALLWPGRAEGGLLGFGDRLLIDGGDLVERPDGVRAVRHGRRERRRLPPRSRFGTRVSGEGAADGGAVVDPDLVE